MTVDAFTIKNTRVFDPRSLCWTERDLNISDGMFCESPAASKRTHDFRGLFILPGLIDAHAHVFGEASPILATNFTWDEEAGLAFTRAEHNCGEFLRHGVTTIRDLGGFEDRCLTLRSQILTGKIIGPRLLVCGQFITTARRHDHAFGFITEPGDLPRAVELFAAKQVDWIKIINDPIDFTADELSNATEIAHGIGRPVACHAFSEEATLLALDAGVDSIEHSPIGWPSVLRHPSARRTQFFPTIVCAVDVVVEPKNALIDDPALIEIYEQWRSEHNSLLPNARQLGLQIGVGTDAGFPPTAPGESLHRELAALAAVGYSNEEVLAQATYKNAVAIHADGCGVCENGFHADFLVLREEPQVTTGFADKIVSVCKGGRSVYGQLIIGQNSPP